MSDPPHDRQVTPDQRRHEVASILARGILRLHSLAHSAPDSADLGRGDDAPEPPETDLELDAITRPDVTNG